MTKLEISAMVAALGPVVDGSPVYAIEPDNYKSGVDSADTKIRILLPSNEGDLHTGEPKGVGAQTKMVWIIKDLYLHSLAGDAMGWYSVGYALDSYCDSYVSVLTAANHSTTGFCSIAAEVQGWDILTGEVTYNNRKYYGVLITLRVLSYVQG